MITRVNQDGWIVIGEDLPIRLYSWDFGSDKDRCADAIPDITAFVETSQTETQTENAEISDDEAFDLMDKIRKEMRK